MQPITTQLWSFDDSFAKNLTDSSCHPKKKHSQRMLLHTVSSYLRLRIDLSPEAASGTTAVG